MSKQAYLTIDDGPSEYTKDLVDYLNKKNIPAIMFFIGQNVDLHEDMALYAIKNGMIIGNHSYTHPKFSELSLSECIVEIERADEVIKRLYNKAGCPNYDKIFRFCYGDKGGANKDELQKYFRTNGYKKLDCGGIIYRWFSENKLDTDIDILWTFDYAEYNLLSHKWTSCDVLNHMLETEPELGGSLLNKTSEEILLIHDIPKTNEYYNGYFIDLIERTLDMGISFKKPNFI